MSAAVVSEKIQGSSKVANVALWIVQIAVGGMFLMAGSAKLSGDPMMVGMFDKLGAGQWFRYLTGTLEVLGGIGLFTPFASGAAALGLVFVMIGAVATHLFILGGSAAPAIVLLIASGLIAWGRRSQLAGLLRYIAK